MLPRAQFDVSAMYYQKDLYEDDANKQAFQEEYGYELSPRRRSSSGPTSQVLRQPARLLRHQCAGKEEAIAGRFYKMLRAEGGEFQRRG